MTYPVPPPQPTPLESPPADRHSGRPGSRWASAGDVRAGVYLVVAMAVLGAALGVLWQWWSPPGPRGFVIAPHAIQPDETEAFVASDGRFAVICAATGLLVALVAWFRTSRRGPVTVLALGVGGVLGALLTDVVGHLLGGGEADGKAQTVLPELSLWVHMRGLLLLEATVAVLVYGLCVAFAAADDLGRPEPHSIGTGDQMEFGWGGADAPGADQQPYFPPQ